jgi:hypothetical protein
VAGDHIWLQGGATFSGMLYLDNLDAGTPSNPVTVGSYGSGRATIDAGAGMGVFVYNTGGIRISNIRVVGPGHPSNQTTGILFYMQIPGNIKLDTVQIDNVEASGFGKYGIMVLAWAGKSGYRNVSITNSIAHDNGEAGINIAGTSDGVTPGYSHENVVISRCRVYDNHGIPGLGRGTGHGILYSDVNGGSVQRSVASNNGSRNTANGGPVGFMIWDSNNISLEFNESHHNRTGSQSDGGGFDFDGGTTNSIMQYNYSHDNDGAGLLLAQFPGARPHRGNVIRYNVSQNDGRLHGNGGVHVWNGGSGISDADIHNNTVYITPGSRNNAALLLGSSTTNLRIRNNIFTAAGGSLAFWAEPGQYGLQLQGNCYWAYGGPLMMGNESGFFYDLPSMRAASGLERLNGSDTGFAVDPRLVAPGGGGTLDNANWLGLLTAYRLQPGSPLIDGGLNLPGWFGTYPGVYDYFGTPSLQGSMYDVGAAESSR